MAKRIFSGLLCCLFCCLLVVPCLLTPAKAINVDLGDAVTFFDWLWERSVFAINGFIGLFDENVCPNSTNTNGLHNFVERHTQVDGKVGNYYVCEYCGKSVGEVGKDAYTDYVDTLPATGFGSDGGLYLLPDEGHFDFYQSISQCYYCSHSNNSSNVSSYNFTADFNCDGYLVSLRVNSGKASFQGYNLNFTLTYTCPVDGNYSYYSYGSYTGYYIDTDGGTHNFDRDINSSASIGYKAAGSKITFRSYCGTPYGKAIYAFYQLTPAVIKVVPYDYLIDSVIGIYDITTRPTTITGGNYGIVGDNGELTIVNGDIINETNNTYYNPSTGILETIADWLYDYLTRSYTLTLETGDIVTVTYGDENITIVEGDTVYNIYYIIEGSGSGSGSGESHVHEWSQTGMVPCAALPKTSTWSAGPFSPFLLSQSVSAGRSALTKILTSLSMPTPSASPSWTANGYSVLPFGRCSTATTLRNCPKSPGNIGMILRTVNPPLLMPRKGPKFARFRSAVSQHSRPFNPPSLFRQKKV